MKKSNGLCLSENETIVVEEDWAPRVITQRDLRRELGLRCYLCKWVLKGSSLWSTLPAELKVKIWDALLAIPAFVYTPFWDQIRSAHDGAWYRMARFRVYKATWNPVDLNRVPVFLRQTCMLNYAFVKEEDYGPCGIDALLRSLQRVVLAGVARKSGQVRSKAQCHQDVNGGRRQGSPEDLGTGEIRGTHEESTRGTEQKTQVMKKQKIVFTCAEQEEVPPCALCAAYQWC